jgi:hypothetical protein
MVLHRYPLFIVFPWIFRGRLEQNRRKNKISTVLHSSLVRERSTLLCALLRAVLESRASQHGVLFQRPY